MENETGKLTKALAGGRRVRVLGIDLTTTALQMCEAHKLHGPAAELASEALVATLLMSGQIKGEERLTLQIRFDGFSGSFIGEVNSKYHMRAMMRPARVKWTLGDTLEGLVLAIKHDANKELYRGVTRLAHQTIEAALVEHLESSAQLDVIVRIGSTMGPNGRPSWVGGLVVEKLADDAFTSEQFDERFGPLREVDLRDGMYRLEDGWLLDEEMDILEIWKVRWKCQCSHERVKDTLRGLGVGILQEIKADPGFAGVTCHFCGSSYTVEAPELQTLIATASSVET